MPVPYFTYEDNGTAFRKMKGLFLVRKIRFVDLCLLLIGAIPLLLNVAIFHLMMGQNEVWRAMRPFGSAFWPSQATARDWGRWHGILHGTSLLVLIFCRVLLSFRLWRLMRRYAQEHRGFSWNKGDRFWLMLFLPFVSFVVYSFLLKYSSRFELSHKYNL